MQILLYILRHMSVTNRHTVCLILENKFIVMLSVEYIPMQYYDAILIQFTGEDGMLHTIIVDGGHRFT